MASACCKKYPHLRNIWGCTAAAESMKASDPAKTLGMIRAVPIVGGPPSVLKPFAYTLSQIVPRAESSPGMKVRAGPKVTNPAASAAGLAPMN